MKVNWTSFLGLDRKGRFVLGVDQGTFAIRYVLYDRIKRQISRYGSFFLDDSKKENERIHPTIFLKEISKIISKKNLRNLVIHVQGASALTGCLTIPDETDKTYAVQTALKKELPAKIEHYSFFCQEAVRLAGNHRTDKEKPKTPADTIYTYAAVPQEMAAQIVEQFNGIFGTVPEMTVQGYAQEELIKLAESDHSAQGTVALIHAGRSITSISFFKKGVLVYVREIPLAGQDITRAILISCIKPKGGQKGSDLGFAEKLKTAGRIPLNENVTSVSREAEWDETVLREQFSKHQDMTLTEEQNFHLFKAVRGVLTAWIQDIRMTFGFFDDKFKGENVEKIYLSGGMCNYQNIEKYLEKQIGIKVESLKCPQSLKPSETGSAALFESHFHEYANAVSLVLKPDRYANLTPRRFQTGRMEAVAGSFLRMFGALAVAVLMCGFVLFQMQEWHLKSTQQMLQRHRDFLREVEVPYRELARWKKFVDQADAPVLSAAKILKIFAEKSPKNLILSSLVIDRENRKVELEGEIYGDPKKRAITMTEFSRLLQDDPNFKHVEVPPLKTIKTDIGKVPFRLTASLKEIADA